jgi:2-polyprenyl-3-methyl-5-hydroxy-6-metoxy-1,4-benzoquinol methylase
MSPTHSGDNENRLQESQQYWDRQAAAFDNEPDHGLRDPIIEKTWTEWLKKWLPDSNSTILDIGCGTGSLSVVLARLGHQVTGIDLSPAMIELAQSKAAINGLQIAFYVMDAAFPQLPQQYDVIICRHLLWALPEPKHVLQRWSEFLQHKGRLILIEGYWKTGAGLHADEITKMLPSSLTNIIVENLSEQPNFWGGHVTDERYAIIADRKKSSSI